MDGTPRGKLKIFLGYAAGVGKTYQMLTEAQALKKEGRDVVIGYFEPHGRKETIARTEGLEFIPRRAYQYRGGSFEEMDTAAVIARHPDVAAVDEFAHTNAPGAEHPKRWQDVMAILDAGIDVLTSLNVQHIESLNDQVWHVTGIRVRETVPDWVVGEANDVVMVDVTPRALLHRLERGVVYAPEKAASALENFFTESNLTALRELALRQTAHQVEERREELRLPQPVNLRTTGPLRAERILIWLTSHPSTAMLIRRGRRVADYLNSSCTAIYVKSAEDPVAIERYLSFCRNLKIEPAAIESNDAAKAVATYAREKGITQIYVTRNAPDVQKLVQLARDIQVTIVAERKRS
ncbi:MAG TPA: sensor histidine kinase KdpD [Bryobacteraceae bacterium]|jgi:two-component system sensor histidine kinase KdpD|nr:sensor histidine kinase KdpD [Bryobacteraceae bacterium]